MKRILLASGLVAMLALTGCATMLEQGPAPLSLEQIVERAKQGKDAAAIINEIKSTHAMYDIAASQYVKLSRDGVPDAVLDFMQQGQLKLAERAGRREAYSEMWFRGAGWYGYGPRWYPRSYMIYVHGRPYAREW